MSDIVNYCSVLRDALPFVTTIAAAALGATVFKWYETWHNAELASRALSGLTSKFARHCIYNMVRITQFYKPLEFPSDTILKKQKFVLNVASDATRDRMHLIGTDLIFYLEALFLRLRNFNIEIEFARKNKLANDDIKKVLDYIFLKNMQLAVRSDGLANDFDKLIKKSKNISYSMRLLYMWQNRRTIFNKNDFQPKSKNISYSMRLLYIWQNRRTILNENDFQPGAQKLDRLTSLPPPCKVDCILKTYLDYEDSEKKEYGKLIKTYKEIYDDYPGYQPEWFGVKWTSS